jgi:hypothetical protein
MYKVIKSVIESKRYELAEMLTKIDTFWVQGSITEEERNELVALAREKALPENSYAGQQERMDALYKELTETRKELEALTVRVKILESAGSEELPEEPEEDIPDEYPEYVAPTGAHDAYYAGDKVTYNGVKYICVAPKGAAVVWNPDVMPSYWQEVTEENSATE